MWLSLTFTLSHLTIWCSRQTALFLFFIGKGVTGLFVNYFLCGTEATLSFLTGPVCSSFSVEACAILQDLYWSWQTPQVCHFSFSLLLSNSRHPVLSSVFPFTLNSLADLAGTVFSPLLYQQTTMGTRTLVSPEKRRG